MFQWKVDALRAAAQNPDYIIATLLFMLGYVLIIEAWRCVAAFIQTRKEERRQQ